MNSPWFPSARSLTARPWLGSWPSTPWLWNPPAMTSAPSASPWTRGARHCWHTWRGRWNRRKSTSPVSSVSGSCHESAGPPDSQCTSKWFPRLFTKQFCMLERLDEKLPADFLLHLYSQPPPFDQLLPVLSGSARSLCEWCQGQRPCHQQAHQGRTTRALQTWRCWQCRWGKPWS